MSPSERMEEARELAGLADEPDALTLAGLEREAYLEFRTALRAFRAAELVFNRARDRYQAAVSALNALNLEKS